MSVDTPQAPRDRSSLGDPVAVYKARSGLADCVSLTLDPLRGSHLFVFPFPAVSNE